MSHHSYITSTFSDLSTQQEFLLLLLYTSCKMSMKNEQVSICAPGNALLKTNLPTFHSTGGLIDMQNGTPSWFH